MRVLTSHVNKNELDQGLLTHTGVYFWICREDPDVGSD